MEDDFFSDDGLDALPNNTLHELEQQALSSTQRPKTATGPPPPQVNTAARPPPAQPLRRAPAQPLRRQPSYTSNVKTPWRPPMPRQPVLQHPSALPASAPEPPSSDYGLDDEEVINLDEPSMLVQPASIPHRPTSRYGSRAPLDAETEAAFAAADAELGSQLFGRRSVTRAPSAPAMDVSALQARIAELEAEQAKLRQSEQEARRTADARKGEIAIVRSSLQKTTKTFEERIAIMQKLHAQEASKQKAELDVGRKEREKMQTDNRFLAHEAAQEAERAKRAIGAGAAKARATSNRETPKKSKRSGLGDGFNDGEVRPVSPSRSRDKSREHTPKVGAKRKRQAQDSPVPLAFSQPPPPVRHHSSEQAAVSFEQAPAPAMVVTRDDGRFEFLQLILNHRPDDSEERTFESLINFSFPSTPGRSVSSMFLDKVNYGTAKGADSGSLPLLVARVLLKLWSRCFNERYLAPFHLILDLLRCSLHSEPASTKASLIEEALPLCTQTIDLITLPVVRASTNATFAASLDREAFEKLTEEAAVDDILDLLHHDLCDAATLSSERLETFWHHIDWNSLIMLLNKAQPLNQITSTLQILRTAALSITFGPISPDVDKQVAQERNTIDKLSTLLFELPIPPTDEPPYTEAELADLRVHILHVFRAMCQTEHGSLLLAQHRSFLGRLIRFLHGQVYKLYTVRPDLGLPYSDPPSAHALISTTINSSVQILYHLLRTHSSSDTTEGIDIAVKCRAVLGGYHKFLIALTRIAFTDQMVFEAGIEDGTAEAAHAILDNVLGPEEGEAIRRAVETPGGTGGSGRVGAGVQEVDDSEAGGDEDEEMGDG